MSNKSLQNVILEDQPANQHTCALTNTRTFAQSHSPSCCLSLFILQVLFFRWLNALQHDTVVCVLIDFFYLAFIFFFFCKRLKNVVTASDCNLGGIDIVFSFFFFLFNRRTEECDFVCK